MPHPLAVGDELHCPHCGDWHPVFAPNAEGTPNTRDQLSWECRGSGYYAGTRGGTARYETRRPGHRLRVRLYWTDGRVEEPRQTLDVVAQPQLVRRTQGRQLHFAFTGVVDADGFAVFEEQVEPPDDR
jgi:hypothetical protein